VSKIKTIILLLTLSCNIYAKGIDVSEEYLFSKTQIQNHSFNDELLTSYLKSQTVLLIPGVLSQSFSSTSTQRIKIDYLIGSIFRDHEDWLIEKGINYESLEIESEASPEENKEFIIQILEELPDNIIIFTHSKGGLDTFEALVHRPDLLEKITGVITVQTPFKGAPVADAFTRNSLVKNISEWLFRFLGGSEGGILSLTTKESRLRNQKYNEDFQRIIQEIPVINYGSFKEDTFGWDTPLEIFRDYTYKKAGKSDGVVPLENSFLDNTYQVTESGVDHLNSVTNTQGVRRLTFLPQLNYKQEWTFDRKSHFQALLEVLRKVSY